MKTVKTFTATIYVGRLNRDTDDVCPMEVIENVIQKYVDSIGLCVTVTPTTFYYTDGKEDGVAIGLINYPRFPSSRKEILGHAKRLGEILLRKCIQYKVSIVSPKQTFMIEVS